MKRIADVKILSYYENDGIAYGIYLAKFHGDDKVFIQNGDSFGVICHFLNEPANKCVSIVRNDVANELKMAIEKIDRR